MCQSLEADIQMGVLVIEKLTFLQYGQYDKNATIMEGRGILLLFYPIGDFITIPIGDFLTLSPTEAQEQTELLCRD